MINYGQEGQRIPSEINKRRMSRIILRIKFMNKVSPWEEKIDFVFCWHCLFSFHLLFWVNYVKGTKTMGNRNAASLEEQQICIDYNLNMSLGITQYAV